MATNLKKLVESAMLRPRAVHALCSTLHTCHRACLRRWLSALGRERFDEEGSCVGMAVSNLLDTVRKVGLAALSEEDLYREFENALHRACRSTVKAYRPFSERVTVEISEDGSARRSRERIVHEIPFSALVRADDEACYESRVECLRRVDPCHDLGLELRRSALRLGRSALAEYLRCIVVYWTAHLAGECPLLHGDKREGLLERRDTRWLQRELGITANYERQLKHQAAKSLDSTGRLVEASKKKDRRSRRARLAIAC